MEFGDFPSLGCKVGLPDTAVQIILTEANTFVFIF